MPDELVHTPYRDAVAKPLTSVALLPAPLEVELQPVRRRSPAAWTGLVHLLTMVIAGLTAFVVERFLAIARSGPAREFAGMGRGWSELHAFLESKKLA